MCLGKGYRSYACLGMQAVMGFRVCQKFKMKKATAAMLSCHAKVVQNEQHNSSK